MEAYVRLRKSLASKSRNKKSSGSKPPSSPKTIAPIGVSLSDVDGCIAGRFELFSQSFDQRFELLSDNILDRFNELATSMSARLSNLSFTAEPGVPVRKLVHGQDASLSLFVSIDGYHHEFQETGGDPVIRGSDYAHPSGSGESLVRDSSLGPAAAQSQAPLFGASEPAQSQSLSRRQRVTFHTSAGPSVVSPDGQEEEDDDRDSMASASPVLDKTFTG